MPYHIHFVALSIKNTHVNSSQSVIENERNEEYVINPDLSIHLNTVGSHTISKSQEVTKTKKTAELREILNNVSECLSIANEDKLLQYGEKTLKVLYNYMCTGTRKRSTAPLQEVQNSPKRKLNALKIDVIREPPNKKINKQKNCLSTKKKEH
ncbi:hypothetical protein NQ314_011754 [Rhamnusium bicolor]|uniref:Uncharacterized protein n=1 Tax=Rhamnusium bicolor TaxID=1586634 RepID=A0AAV8XFF1_9CUCU|nr:hypothetical protein NQ314_011754 [Rhamnusium bicolor]